MTWIDKVPASSLAALVAAAGGHHVFVQGQSEECDTFAALLGRLMPMGSAKVRAEDTVGPRDMIGTVFGTTEGWRMKPDIPGLIAAAHGGLLYLRDAPSMHATVLDALRQPLEAGKLSVSNGGGYTHIWEARIQLLIAAYVCAQGHLREACDCSAMMRRRYLSRISGPLMDRVDVRVQLTADEDYTPAHAIMGFVDGAQIRAEHRLRATPWDRNGQVPGSWLRSDDGRLAAGTTLVLDRALERGGLTMRGYDRVQRVAWTLVDLDNEADVWKPTADHIELAMKLRGTL